MDPVAKTQTAIISDFFEGPGSEENYDRLVKFAHKQVELFKFASTVGAQDPQFYVNEAIKRCLPDENGVCRRTLDPAVPTRVALKGVVKSVISHDLFPSQARQKSRVGFEIQPGNKDEKEVGVDDHHTSLWVDGRSDHPGDAIDLADTIEEFAEFIREDDEVYRMVRLVIDEGIEEPAALVAQRIGMSEAQVYVARKRLQRLTERFREEIIENELK